MQRLLSAKMTFIVLAAITSVPLTITSEVLGLQYNLSTSPGAYVWGLLHPDEGSLASMFGTMFAIDSICWFILLCLTGSIIARLRKRNDADRIDTPARR